MPTRTCRRTAPHRRELGTAALLMRGVVGVDDAVRAVDVGAHDALASRRFHRATAPLFNSSHSNNNTIITLLILLIITAGLRRPQLCSQ